MKNRTTLILVIIIALLIAVGFIGKGYYEGKIGREQQAYKSLVLKNDTLQKVNDTQYRRLVADTLTKGEMSRLIDSLGIALDAKPKVVIQTEIIIKEVIKYVDSIEIEGDSIHVVDHYPSKEDYFVRYQNDISISTQTGVSKFTFIPVDISIVLSQREDGIFTSDIKVPEYMEVSSVDIRALPFTPTVKNNFGWLIGAGAGKDLNKKGTSLRISGGLRYKKFYILVGGSSNGTVDGAINLEF